jgi:hypothetical protein
MKMRFVVSSTHNGNNESVTGFQIELAELPALIGNVRQVNTASAIRQERFQLFRRVYLEGICNRVDLTWDARRDAGCGPAADERQFATKLAELERLLNHGDVPQRPVTLFSQTDAKFWIETADQNINQVTKHLTEKPIKKGGKDKRRAA